MADSHQEKLSNFCTPGSGIFLLLLLTKQFLCAIGSPRKSVENTGPSFSFPTRAFLISSHGNDERQEGVKTHNLENSI